MLLSLRALGAFIWTIGVISSAHTPRRSVLCEAWLLDSLSTAVWSYHFNVPWTTLS